MPASDRKMRYGGLLENPHISKIQRDILDYRRRDGLEAMLAPLKLERVLDVGCGLGENSRACRSGYVGIDNSAPRIFYAGKKYPSARFILGDGVSLPVQPKSFDMVMLLDTSHHLTDEDFVTVVNKMTVVSRQWVLVSDPVLFEGQNRVSRFFYSLDRGGSFRTAEAMRGILARCPGIAHEQTQFFTTFPGIYRRGMFLLKVQ